MSGFAPIRNNDGELVGFVGIDFSLAQLQRKEFPLQLTYLLGLVGSAGFSVLAANFHRRSLKARARAFQSMAAADRAKSTFLATLSHEIRTPLHGVLGMMGLLLASELSAQQRECLVIAHSSSLAQAKALDLSLVIGPEVPQAIRTDAIRLRQILLNLIGNAIKFTEAGSVVVCVQPAARTAREQVSQPESGALHLAFCVTDTGVGMAADQMGLLFHPFPPTRQLSQQLVAALGGTIQVESTPGRGSVFSFNLPVEAVAAAPAPAPALPPPAALRADAAASRLRTAVRRRWPGGAGAAASA